MRTLTLCCCGLLLLAMLAGPRPAVAQDGAPNAESGPGVATGTGSPEDGATCTEAATPVEPDADAAGQTYPNEASTEEPDPKAPTVNSLDYMRNTNWPNGLCSDDTGWPVCVHYTEQPGNRFFYVKGEDGRYFERFAWDSSYVSLERDTTWGNDGLGNNSYDAMPYGSLRWAKLTWSLGQSYTYATRIVGFNSMGAGSCNYAQHPHEYNDSNFKQLTWASVRCWGGDVGCADTIGIYYPSGDEVHYYARGWGWVAWEHPRGATPKTWIHRAGNQVAPVDSCAPTLGSWQAVFLNQDGTRNPGYGDWDFCRYKASCAPGESVNGVSEVPGGFARTALCRVHGTGGYPGTFRAVLKAENGDQRRAYRSINGSTDWDTTFWKLECGLDEYVAGTSNNAPQCYGNTRFHGVLCARAASVSAVCSVRPFDSGDNRVTTTSGDWDFGAYKGECGLTSYVAGISVSPGSGRPHALLCCHP